MSSGVPSPELALQPGDNGIEIKVTAQDSRFTKTCTLTVTLAVIPPAVWTSEPAHITFSSATLQGMVDPRGVASATTWFEWGRTTSYGSLTPPVEVPGSPAPAFLSAALSDLTSSTKYHYRAVASNCFGITYGGDVAFETPRSFLPKVETLPPRDVITTIAILNGQVDTFVAIPTAIWFE